MSERLSRGAVVDRAAVLADEIGLDELTITKLGRTLGIAPPGVYRHVNDLGDLRSAIGQQSARELASELTSACAGRAGREALGALASTLRRWASAHPGRYAALEVPPPADDSDGQAAAATLYGAFIAALHAYSLTGDDLTDAVRLLRSTLHGFVALDIGGGFAQPRSPDSTFERIVDAMDAVLRRWAS